MDYLVTLLLATALSLVVIPVMAHLAPRVGLLDHPDPRKVHADPIPRVGGWGIVLGSLAALLLWAPAGPLLHAYLAGSLVLFAFGVWDDRREMGHLGKFAGQLLAVLPLVTWGDLTVARVPFLAEPLPAAIAAPFTVLALVGTINAVNHSDGLDGLAGGEVLLSLAAIAYLAGPGSGAPGPLIAVACMGGLVGFLRYNTHPARLFMGDAGSQFLGFTLGTLAILLTQRLDPTVSPGVVLLLLGLPIADILVVFYKRVRAGMNWFRATRNHLHHRLLRLGFSHRDAVVLIYAVHTTCVALGVVLPRAPDWLAIGLYLLLCLLLFALVGRLERADGDRLAGTLRRTLLVGAPRRVLSIALPVYLVAVSLAVDQVPVEFGLAGAAIGTLLLADSLTGQPTRALPRRALLYAAGASAVYLQSIYLPLQDPLPAWAEVAFFVLLALAAMAAIAFSPGRRRFEFRPTALDYLVAVLVTAALLLLPGDPGGWVGPFALKLAVVFYATELLVIEKRPRWNELSIAALAAAAVLAFRGLV